MPESDITSVNNSSRRVRIISPYARHLDCRIRRHEQGIEIGEFLVTRFPFRSHEEWVSRLSSGWITQGDRSLAPGDSIRPGKPLTLYHPNHLEPAVPDEVVIIQKSPDFLLVYKPAPMPVHPGGRYNKNSLTSILQEQILPGDIQGESPMPFRNGQYTLSRKSGIHVLHRLDSVTSGLILFGLNHPFSRSVQLAFSQGQVEKFYLAVVSGLPKEDEMTISLPISRKKGYVFACTLNGKASLTEFRVLQRFADSALVLCVPRTGRTHQIRLHLKAWGHPVIDDPVYGHQAPPDAGADNSNGLTGNESHDITPMQNDSISLIHFEMRFPGLGLTFRLPDLSEFCRFPIPFHYFPV